MSNITVINTDYIEKPTVDTGFDEIRELVYEGETGAKVTIVVQAFGRLKKTEECVRSLLENTRDVSYKLILVDNGTVGEEIQNFYETVEYAEKRILRITKNITGVLAVNYVMKYIDTKYMVIVNNDVIVTPNWLKNLLICAESDASIGMVCPVSTNISNNQWEDLGGFSSVEEMFEKAEEYNKSNPCKWEERIRLIPTVVLYRREIFDRVGSYDISFLHDFGDDDYSFRIRREGYKLILCRDTFVHHNHNILTMEDKNSSEAFRVSNKGKLDFQKKYKGIDAWEDTSNSIASYLSLLHREEKLGRRKVLAIEPRCGTPILDLKNYYRQHGIFEVESVAVTSKIEYYIDLKCICEEVKVNPSQELGRIYEKYMFDVVAMCEPVNLYERPDKWIKEMYDMVKVGGALLFPVKNVCDYRNFLYSLNVTALREKNMPKVLYYQDVYEQISKYGAKDINLVGQNFVVQQEIVDEVQQLYQKMLGEEDAAQVINNLFIENFWFIIQK